MAMGAAPCWLAASARHGLPAAAACFAAPAQLRHSGQRAARHAAFALRGSSGAALRPGSLCPALASQRRWAGTSGTGGGDGGTGNTTHVAGSSARSQPETVAVRKLPEAPHVGRLHTPPPVSNSNSPDMKRAAKLRELRAQISWKIAKLEGERLQPVLSVRGAGVEEANGEYVRCDSHEGIPCYESEHCYLMRYTMPDSSVYWYISLKEGIHTDEGDLYRVRDNSPDVPIGNVRWQCALSGKEPLPEIHRIDPSVGVDVKPAAPRPNQHPRASTYIRTPLGVPVALTGVASLDWYMMWCVWRGLLLVAMCWIVHTLYGYGQLLSTWFGASAAWIAAAPPPVADADSATEAAATAGAAAADLVEPEPETCAAVAATEAGAGGDAPSAAASAE
eukprot:TRINITY_DN50223_c0_g1_i1.p1 TRINITY_DN50223_c0_g1~~TRINITY_DN50223_c0_g1_i1.p1  ORF type:complete len:416 (+),score=78.06 TRINITY_DN50223_c0_g1_i1:77-1249(+)